MPTLKLLKPTTKVQWKSFNPKLLSPKYRFIRNTRPVPPNSFFITSNSTFDIPNFLGRFSSIFRLVRSDLGGKTYKISRKQLKHTTNDKFWAFKNSFLIENPNQRFQSESIMKSRTKSRLVHERDKVRNSNMATMLHWEHRYLAFLRLNLTRFIGLNFPF